MIKLLGLLFIFAPLYSQEYLFTFPDHHSRFVHEINLSFKKSASILILTPSYHHTKLTKGILSAVKHGTDIKMITHDPHGEPLSLIQYQHIRLYLSSVRFTQSVILVNNTLVCTSNEAIDEEIFSSRHSSFICNDDPSKIRSIRLSLEPILKSSTPYLE